MAEKAATSVSKDWTVQDLLSVMRTRDSTAAVTVFSGDVAFHTSYAELADLSARLAGGLLAAGVRPGDTVVLYGPNSVAWIAVRLAAGVVGAITVAIDDLMADNEAAGLLAAPDRSLLFTTSEHAQSLGRSAHALNLQVYILDETTVGRTGDAAELVGWSSLLANRTGKLPDLDSAAATALMFTSGTTGPPKAFTLSHANLAANVGALVAERLIGPRDRVLLPLPLHHAYPFVVGMLTTLACGATIVLPEAVTGPRIVHALRAASVTTMVGVPRLYAAILDSVVERISRAGRLARLAYRAAAAVGAGLQRTTGINAGRWLFWPIHRQIAPELRLMACGGAHLDVQVAAALEALGWQVLTGYGLAETASIFTANFPGRQRLGSEGQPLSGGAVRIASANSAGEGEIELHGPCITAGYCNNPSANAEAFTADGWFRTGDLGRVDDNGYLFVTGRAKELIVLGGGKNIYPEEIERVYGESSLVDEVALLEHAGQLVALVRPNIAAIRASGILSIQDAVRVALAEAGEQLPAYARLSGYALTDRPLPRTRLGKYRRFLLPELYECARSGLAAATRAPLSAADQALLATPAIHEIWTWLNERYPGQVISPDSNLSLELGIDSLAWLHLSLELAERFGIELAESDIADMVTMRDLLQCLARHGAQPATEDRVATVRQPERYVAPAGPLTTALGAALYLLTWCAMRWLFRLHVRGAQYIPSDGSVVIVANHASYLDAPVIAAALSANQAHRTYWGGAVQILFQSAFSRAFCRVAHVFPIDERIPKATLAISRTILSRGDALVWFPEAWRTPDGRLQSFRTGIGTLLIEHRVPVVTAYIDGTFAALPRSRRWPRLRALAVTFARPVTVSELEQEGDGTTAEACVVNALHDRVAALAGQADSA